MGTQGSEWTAPQVQAPFKNTNRKEKTIQTCLDTLTALGAIALQLNRAAGPTIILGLLVFGFVFAFNSAVHLN
jgi:hypothetical protein